MDSRTDQDLSIQAAAVRESRLHWDPKLETRRLRLQYRLYLGLLIFVVLVGLPIVALPALRGRITARVQTLRDALGPLNIQPAPAWAKVGENRYPFPKELERPVVPQSQYSRVVDLSQMVYRQSRQTGEAGGQSTGGSEPTGGSASETSPLSTEVSPEFRQGKVEQEAYELLLKSNAVISGMVKGGDSSLRFKTWTAAKTETAAYLVDLIFVQTSDNSEVHYIWRVNLDTKQIRPESRQARTLPNP